MLDRLESKFGRFAIPNLSRWLIGGYAIGYLLYFATMQTEVNFITMMTLEPYQIIHHFQFWRLITWVMIPPSYRFFSGIIMMIFYYQLGQILERSWGKFRFNLYIFGGIFFTVIGAFLLYGVASWMYPGLTIRSLGNYFSTSYINMSIFLAFALLYGDMQVLLYFILPLKMRWLAILYAAMISFSFITTDWGGRVAIIASLLNFFIFFFAYGKQTRGSRPFQTRSTGQTRNPWNFGPQRDFRPGDGARSSARARSAGGSAVRPSSSEGISRHKCAVCGRTELTNPELEFRFCSKCHGNYEYCQDHLFNHKHVE